MPDKLPRDGADDSQRIDMKQEFEFHHWAKEFGISEQELSAAVQAVGDRVGAVEEYLSAHRPTGG